MVKWPWLITSTSSCGLLSAPRASVTWIEAAVIGRLKASTSRPARMPLTSGSKPAPGASAEAEAGRLTDGAGRGVLAAGALGSAQNGARPPAGGGTLAAGGFFFGVEAQPAGTRQATSRLMQATTRTNVSPSDDRPRTPREVRRNTSRQSGR